MPHAVRDSGKKTFPSLSSSLGVKGDLRVRPYGNVKHAHLILRKVDEEDYVDSNGNKRRRAIFSFFAQKLINVKPGKELYLYLQSTNGDVKEVPIAFEADLAGPDEQPFNKEENSFLDVQEVKKEIKEPDVREQAVPPKMRKAWLKKQESNPSLQVLPSPTSVPATNKISAGVQTRHETNSVGIQTSLPFPVETPNGSRVKETSAKKHADIAMKSIEIDSSITRSANRPQLTKKSIDRSQSIDLSSATGDVDDFKSRSLSPMDLESPATTPPVSPRIIVDTVKFRKSLSPLYSPQPESPVIPAEVDEIPTDVFTDPLRPPPLVLKDQKSHIINNAENAKFSAPDSTIESNASVNDTPLTGGLQSAYNEMQAMIQEHETRNLKSTVAAKKPLPGFVKATLPLSSLLPTVASPTLRGKQPQDMSSPSQTNVASKVKGFVSSFVPVSNDQITTKSRASLSKRHETRQAQAHTAPTSPKSLLYNTAQYSPLSPSINSVASSSKVTVERVKRRTPLTTSTPITTLTSNMAATPILGPPPILTPMMTPPAHAPTSITTPAPIPIPLAHNSSHSFTTVSTGMNPPSSQGTPHLNGNSHRPSEPSLKTEETSFKVKQEMLSPVLLPLDLPPLQDEGAYDPGSSNIFDHRGTPSFDDMRPENGFEHLPISIVHAADPNYVSDEMEFELPPPRPAPEPRYDSNGIKLEPIDIPLSFTDFGFQNNSTEFSSPRNNNTFHSPNYAPLPAKPYIPQNDGSLKRHRVDSVDSDDESKRRCPFRRVCTGQIRFDFGAGIRDIFFNHSGSHFAVICYDHTIRVWNNRARVEIAKLTHNAPVITALWLKEGMALLSLGMNGVVNKWACSARNQWHWSRLLDTGDVEPSAMDYRSDRVAVAFPRVGVRLWILVNGFWQQQRIIRTVHVLAVKFVGRGDTILSACADGRLWRGFVHDGTKEVCHVTRTKIFGLDLDMAHRHAVITEAGGKAHVLTISPHGQKFTVISVFGTKDIESRRKVIHPFGALFASRNNLVVFGSIGDGIFLWNKSESSIISELNHGDNVLIQAVANLDEEGGMTCLLTGSKEGRLSWWTAPASLFDIVKAEPFWKRPRLDF